MEEATLKKFRELRFSRFRVLTKKEHPDKNGAPPSTSQFLTSPFLLIPSINMDARRYIAYKDVREAKLPGEKAVLLVRRYGLSQKAASRALNVNLIVVRKALKAHEEGRPIGRVGRPESLTTEEKAELTACVEKLMKEHRSPTKRVVASEVRWFFQPYIAKLIQSNDVNELG